MSKPLLYSLIESPTHPDCLALYQRLGIEEVSFTSARKAISQLKKTPPDIVVAEFFYGWSNNYAGVNISNLDVLLFSLLKFSPQVRFIVIVTKTERKFVDKLNEILPLHAVLVQPVTERQMETALMESH